MTISDDLLTTKSYDKDGHRKLIFSNDKFAYTDEVLVGLRQECTQLVCHISHKYCTVKEVPLSEDSGADHSHGDDCACCFPRGFLPQNLMSEDDSFNDDSSSADSSALSDGSDSNYTPSDEDFDADELEHISDAASQQSGDDDSIQELYSDFAEQIETAPNSKTKEKVDLTLVDNLICPGDVIQYQEMGKIGSIRKDSVLTIEVSEKSTYMLLKNGDILHPKKHAVRKVQMYVTATGGIIPNPTGQWLQLNKCLLQTGSLGTIDKRDNNNAVMPKTAEPWL